MPEQQTTKRGPGRPRGSGKRVRRAKPTPFPDTGYYCEVDPALQRGMLVRVMEAEVLCPHCGSSGSCVKRTESRFDVGVIERYRECPNPECRRVFVSCELMKGAV